MTRYFLFQQTMISEKAEMNLSPEETCPSISHQQDQTSWRVTLNM